MANNQLSSGKVGFWSNPELRKRLLFLIGALVIFRIGAHVPVPGVDAATLAELYKSAEGGILGMLNMFSGGSLERYSVFAIGIMPYISASAVQSFGVATFMLRQNGIVVISPIEFYVSTVTCLVCGTMFVMWLGEQITERGIGNGISFLITAGIVAGIPSGIEQLWSLLKQTPLLAISLVVGVLVMTYFVVFFESALRKVPVHYAKRQMNPSALQEKNSHIPFKLNMAGVIPPIFASSVIMLPSMFINWVGASDPTSKLTRFFAMLQHGQPLFIVLFAITIIFFCYFYTALTFNPKEISENLKKSGAFIPSIRPGEQTARYLEKLVLHLTLFGALYITIICLIPELLTSFVGVPFYLGGTSLLILVVVVMDLNTQIASYKVSQRYEYLMSHMESSKKD